MYMSPTVSVLMLSHNNVSFLNDAIEGVVSQDYSAWEMIIVDDGSTDGSVEIIQRWVNLDSRIKALHLSTVKVAVALNAGLRQAKGQYIARADSDDVWLPRRLERQLNFMEEPANNDVGVCGSDCFLIDAQGELIGRKNFPISHEECLRAFWYRNPICHPASLIRRSCFDRYGGYDENVSYGEDLELWMRFGQCFRLANIPEYLINYRLHPENATFRQHRSNILSTLKSRRKAVSEYGYKMGIAGHLAFVLTWCIQWCPANMVRHFFHHVFLPHCSWLWRDSRTFKPNEPTLIHDRKLRQESIRQMVR
jgi:glycosyltransferase involved in cell wall biosynthesis